MRVISVPSFGSPDVLRVEERPVPEPSPGEVLVEVKAAGVNLMDSYMRRGVMKGLALPARLGADGAGVVAAVGTDATAKIGDRVAWQYVMGSYADMVAVPHERLVPIPDDVTFEAAAGGLMQGLTAQHLSYDAVPVPSGAVALVHSAASGVGRMLTQLITARGARVIATVSRARKARSAVEAGAWKVLVRDETEDLGAAVRELTHGEGVDFAFDGTGKSLFDVSMSSLRFKGVFVHYGRAGGPIPPLDLWVQPDGVRLVHVRGDAPHESTDEWRQRASQVMQWIGDGTLDVLIDRTYPLGDAAQAHRDLESQETVGKLLLIP
ncbi:quinone oxidoreductase family protein [Streptomyces sp. NPDC058683]|uniref:quinone oxidoreductase family protein n=1 Tax=Streptomyces sp. NPDC058683 TaxID=3346597 RepID=UPI003660928A